MDRLYLCQVLLLFSFWLESYRQREAELLLHFNIHCEIPPNFLVGNFVERHSFCIILGGSPETMQKRCLSTKFPQQEIRLPEIMQKLSTKFPYQEIRWNYGIFRSDIFNNFNELSPSITKVLKNFDWFLLGIFLVCNNIPFVCLCLIKR